MTHTIEESWHRRLAHINYKALPYICKAVTSLPELKGDHEGVCNGCEQGKNIKNLFLKRDNKAKGVLELIHLDVHLFLQPKDHHFEVFRYQYGSRCQWIRFTCLYFFLMQGVPSHMEPHGRFRDPPCSKSLLADSHVMQIHTSIFWNCDLSCVSQTGKECKIISQVNPCMRERHRTDFFPSYFPLLQHIFDYFWP
jgi:hypothetical protein